MQLIGSPTSPYVRKVRVYLEETGATCEFTQVDAWQPSVGLLDMAPLGKVPVLLRDDGSPLFDSLLVLEYLDHRLPEAKRLIPAQGEARWDVLRWHALAHGLIDATVVRVLDSRRPEPLRSASVRAHEEARIARVLDGLERTVADRSWLCLDRLTLADIALGVALQYLDLRYTHDWRGQRPALAAWAGAMLRRPSFTATLPAGFTPVA